jgi:hypothetical protein
VADESGLEPASPQLTLLRDWQVRRLARTYNDFLGNPRYAPSCEFFIDDIYAVHDFNERNEGLRRLYESLRLFAPDTLTRPLSMGIELHELSEALDGQLVAVLVGQLGMSDALSAPLYAEAYRRCANYDVRVRQIQMIVDLGTRVEALVNLPFSGAALKLARGTARSTGQGEVMSFLERGYSAFKHMRGAKPFLNTIRERELRILDRIFESDPDPFGWGADGA